MNSSSTSPVRLRRKEKTSDITLTKAVRIALIYFLVFVIISYITFWVKGSIPDTLVQFGLGGGSVELICSAVIQYAKKKYEGERGDDDGISDSES